MASQLTRLKWQIEDLVHQIPDHYLSWCGFCPYCLTHSITVGRRPTRTAYHEKSWNFEVSCIDCYELHDEYWRDRWHEYYSNCL